MIEIMQAFFWRLSPFFFMAMVDIALFDLNQYLFKHGQNGHYPIISDVLNNILFLYI